MNTWRPALGPIALGTLLALAVPAVPALAEQKQAEDAMSAMGRRAARVRAALEAEAAAAAGVSPTAPRITEVLRDVADDEVCTNDPRCPGGLREGPSGGQAELSIAVDPTGQFIVVGFNDTRGFARNPISVSGYMYSSDYGKTFTDGGQLPVTTGTGTIGTTVFPQIFGDPEVKYLGGCTFIYSSILVTRLSATGTAQTMGVHRSTDCGATWSGPYEVVPATNPGGLLTAGGSARDAADKEFMDVDPDTGRVMMTWTNFGTTSVQIRSAFSDDGGLTWPAANGRLIAATDADGQASMPRFAGNGSNNVYVTWRRFPFPGALFGYGNITAFARSTDNGLTWSAPVELSDEFLTQDLILGNDRSNTSPSMAVDVSPGPHAGNVYVVYPNNDSDDGSDIAFQRSTDGGMTFSAPILINARPGGDRAQWFPWVTVDGATGRVTVFYYDQGVATNGDLSEVTYLYSDDGGRTWAHPRPLTARPFHAGHGNDTGQPNLGDYVQAVAYRGFTYFAYAITTLPPLGFVDGQPSGNMTVPDPVVTINHPRSEAIPHAPLQLRNASFVAPGGYADPGEEVVIQLPVFNYATNPLYARMVAAGVGRLASLTELVSVTDARGRYPSIPPGEMRANLDPFKIRLDRKFEPGTPIELSLRMVTPSGVTTLLYTIQTGTPTTTTTVLTENFDGVSPGALPAGWIASHGAPTGSVVPWTTSNTFCGGSNGAFHTNGPAAGQPSTRWERLFSPTFSVPADSAYVTLEFDVCYNTEDDPVLPTTAYDGFFLRITDLTTGRLLRSVLAEAFASEFKTGDADHYPKHLPRSSNPSYFEDMSVWAGDSSGIKHVKLRLHGMAGSTAQLRFEFTQDSVASCSDVRPGATCGVFVDNVVLKSISLQPPPLPVKTN